MLATAIGAIELTHLNRLSREDRRLARQARSDSYVARSEDSKFQRHLDAAVRADDQQTLAMMPSEVRNEILLVANFFEELARQYNRGALDKEVIRYWFGDVSRLVYRRLVWFMRQHREMHPEHDAFREWVTMNEDFDRQSSERTR